MSSYIAFARREGFPRQERCHPFSSAGTGPRTSGTVGEPTTVDLSSIGRRSSTPPPGTDDIYRSAAFGDTMPLPPLTDEELRRAFTGLVVESLAVQQDVDRGTVQCAACARAGDDAALGVGDIVVVVLRNYEGFTWEIQDVLCNEHRVECVEDAAGIEADDQAVVSSVLEAAGYHSPDGSYHPEALTLGDVNVLDYSPLGEGYAAPDEEADTTRASDADPASDVDPASDADPASDVDTGSNPDEGGRGRGN
jgi:hypothetical protein